MAQPGTEATRARVRLSWETPRTLPNQPAKRLTFAEASYPDEQTGLPAHTLFLEDAVAEFQFVEATYEPLTTEEQSLLQGALLPTHPAVDLTPVVYKKRPATYVSFVPLRRNPQTGAAEKLVSFAYAYRSDPTQGRTVSAPARTQSFATSSVLASGKWYKIGVTESGIYRIDRSLLQQMGFDPGVAPAQLALYGQGGGMLPESLTEAYYDDLPENAISVHTRSDGSFDYLLFYGEGPHTWQYEPGNGRFQHTINIYSDTTYYFLTVKENQPGLRIADAGATLSGTEVTTFDEHFFYEIEQNKLTLELPSGREWYGDVFTSTSLERQLSFSTEGLVEGTTSTLEVRAVSTRRGTGSSLLRVTANNQTLGTLSFLGLTGQYDQLRKAGAVYTPTLSGDNLSLRLRYDYSGAPAAVAYLDYIALNYTRRLALYGNTTLFRAARSRDEALTYRFDNLPDGADIWNITDPIRPTRQRYERNGSTARFGAASTGVVQEYIAFQGTGTAPYLIGNVLNQNLHALTPPHLLILTVPALMAEAERLAYFRQQNDGLSTAVISVQQVYNEFSSGAQDLAALRNFAKMLYDRDANTFRYLLLFGSCSYDYKNRVADNTNLVPIFESEVRSSVISELNSFSSDDFVTFLDEADRIDLWVQEGRSAAVTGDIGVGRLPVTNATEAKAIVDKLIHYETDQTTLGNWRNRVILLSDDGDNNLHIDHADAMGQLIQANDSTYNLEKVYLDAYTQVNTAQGERSPDARQALSNAIQKGAFLFNYSGHGNESALMDERLLESAQIEEFTNYDQLAFFVTATCDFGRYDDPAERSGGERIILSQGAGIGVFTATRLVYTNTNRAINTRFYQSVFERTDGAWPRLGDVVRMTKNRDAHQPNNRNYGMLGDPSMKLAYPVDQAVITQFNGQPIGTGDTLKALERVSLAGEIRAYGSSAVKEDFNGTILVTVFDKPTKLQTRGSANAPYTYTVQKNIIYNGSATVKNGRFSLAFVVPKDIDYQYGQGKIALYARQDASMQDANGSTQRMLIGGLGENVANDNLPPDIALFMNDTTFVFGGTTSPNATLIAQLVDENGINLSSSGIGHDITATLDNNTEDTYILNDYYVTEPDDYQRGTVTYQFKELPLGRHQLTLKAWDTHNNSGLATLEFVVADNAGLALKNVLNYPNPFTTHTTFHFDHNQPGQHLEVRVQIFTVAGKLVKSLLLDAPNSPSHIGTTGHEIVWDGRDEWGDRIGRGVYIYKVDVRSSEGSKAHQYEKLVILN
ncbi:Peptidase family C25 [Catalinimonas alkaloidigena]|uniref:Peptidase family C25 n=2 Tax=Catalinimonas alkaloidigena TaxID=1075417 RepID=A0A1G9M208_9BACT|nr:Peptidase family C25 [Catalinimonas alkaloidigena]